jgi:integrase/recombinase XerD
VKYQAKNSEFHLCPQELEQLLKAAKNSRDSLIIAFFIYTGMRRVEVQKLCVEDVDLLRRRAIIRNGKGGKQRIIFLPDEIMPGLRAFLSNRRKGPLFTGPGGQVMSSRNFNYIVAHTAKAAGVSTPNPRYRDVGPHLLRHSFARAWKASGGSLESLQKILGHSSLKTTLDFYGTESQVDTENNYRLMVQKLYPNPISHS